MGSAGIAVANIVLAGALCVSIARFLSDSRFGAESVRRLAALSTSVALVSAVLIYSGEFRRNALVGLRQLSVSRGFYDGAGNFLLHFDRVCTQIANAVNDLLGAPEVGYRPHPPVWPALLLAASYGVRFLIYRLHKVHDNQEAAMTGAVYWSHITTYAMVMAFLIVIVGMNPSVLVPVSLLALLVIVVSVKLLIEDVGVAIRAALETLWTEITRAARRIVYHATAFAALVRTVLAYANDLYVAKIRDPLRRRTKALERRNEAARQASKDRLRAQETRYRERFDDSARTRRRKR